MAICITGCGSSQRNDEPEQTSQNSASAETNMEAYLAKAIGIKACNRYNVGYFHSEELLESMVALKEQDYDKYARKMKKYRRHMFCWRTCK